jgi:hypothetical protein
MTSKDKGMDFASYEHLWNGAETGLAQDALLENRRFPPLNLCGAGVAGRQP